MGFIRVFGSNHTVDLSEGEYLKVAHTTGNFTINHTRITYTVTAASAANAQFLPLSEYGTIQNDTVLAFVNGVAAPGYAASNIFLFDTGFEAGDELTFTFYSSLASSTISHTGSGLVDLVLNDGEIVLPGTSIVSLEQTS